VHRLLFGGKVFFWQSGTTHAHERKKRWDIAKLKWFFRSQVPFLFTLRYVDYLVTGPEPMVDYYRRLFSLPSHRVRLLYNDIDIERFRPVESDRERRDAKQALGIPADVKVFYSFTVVSGQKDRFLYPIYQ
jgi:hypothetical protein